VPWRVPLTPSVEMFKVRMQGQSGNPLDKRLCIMAREMWAEWWFWKGIMCSYWVRSTFSLFSLPPFFVFCFSFFLFVSDVQRYSYPWFVTH
jgi:hypothetical protein